MVHAPPSVSLLYRCANCKQPLSSHTSQPKNDEGLKPGSSVRNIITKHEASSRGVSMPEGAPHDALPSSSVRDRTSSLLKAAKGSSTSATPVRRTTVSGAKGTTMSGSLSRKEGGLLAEKLNQLESASSASTPAPRPSSDGLQRSGSVRASLKAFMQPPVEKKNEGKPQVADAPSMSLRDRLASLSGAGPKPFEADADARASAVKEALKNNGAGAEEAPVGVSAKLQTVGEGDEDGAAVTRSDGDSGVDKGKEAPEETGSATAIAENVKEVVKEESFEDEPEKPVIPAIADVGRTKTTETEGTPSAAPPAVPPVDVEEQPEPEEEMDEDERELAELRRQIEALKAGVPAPSSAPSTATAPSTAPPTAVATVSSKEKPPSPDFYGSDDDDHGDAGHPTDAAAGLTPKATAAVSPFNPFATAGSAAPKAPPAKAAFNPFA